MYTKQYVTLPVYTHVDVVSKLKASMYIEGYQLWSALLLGVGGKSIHCCHLLFLESAMKNNMHEERNYVHNVCTLES